MKDQLLKNLQSATSPASIVLRADFEIGIFNASTFPGIGQLIFDRGNVPCLVLDSHASVTNMLEGTVQLPGTEAPIFAGLPYVRMVNQDGGYEATSLTLPHRLGSGYLAKNNAAMLGGQRYNKQLIQEIQQNGLHLTMLRYCPMSLLHGAWFSQMSGNHKVAKSVGGRLVAENVKLAQVGGTLMDRVRQESASLDLSSFEKEEADGDKKADGKGDKASKLGIGMIPHDGKRYCADRVVGEFFINYGQINSFKIPKCGKDLLKALAVYEVYAFLATVPMHRSDCQMTLKDISYLNADIMLGGKKAESVGQAQMAVESAIKDCGKEGLFAGVSEVTVELKNKPEEKKGKAAKKGAAIETTAETEEE
jgi:CRISPR-associated protein Csb1